MSATVWTIECREGRQVGRVNKANLRNLSPVLAVRSWRSHMVYVFNV